jgi:ATP-binding cassette subfamily B multidrug efflux pump
VGSLADKSRKVKFKKNIILRLLSYLAEHKALMILAIILTIAANLLSLEGPYFSGLAIDAISPGGGTDFGRVGYLCLLMIIIYAVSAALSFSMTRIMVIVSRKVVYKMRKQVFEKLAELPVGYYDMHQTGDLLSRISYDIDTINTSLSTDLVQIFASSVTIVGSLVMMLRISSALVLVFAFTVPLSIFLTKKITSFTRPMFRKRSAKLGELNGFVEEQIGGQKTIKAYNQEKQTIKKFDGVNEDAVSAYYKAEYYGSTVGPSVNFVNNLSLSLITFFGAIMFMKGGISIGNISSFVLYSRKFSGPINELANIIGELQSAMSAAERVFTMLDEPPEPEDSPDAQPLSRAEGNVEFKHVYFGYNKDEPTIKDLNMKIAKGSTIAIVGPTGAGKTTIINLLMRFYDTDSGEILMDGHDIKKIKRADLRRSYAMVLQDTWLFEGTVYENIAYGKENVTLEDVKEACCMAGVDDFINTLPKGYDTILSDDGGNISKGQKQLLTIARAMMIDAQLLILDEATSNVDTRTEIKIQEAMLKLMHGKTCFVIAHRLSTIQNADLIIVINNGEIIEKGTHKQLMSENSFYSKMYNSQFE